VCAYLCVRECAHVVFGVCVFACVRCEVCGCTYTWRYVAAASVILYISLRVCIRYMYVQYIQNTGV